jgi:hypothetical protein
MTYAQLERHFGSIAAIADSLGFSRGAVYAWRERGIPLRTQRLIRALCTLDSPGNRKTPKKRGNGKRR